MEPLAISAPHSGSYLLKRRKHIMSAFELLGKKFVTKDGVKDNIELKGEGKVVGLYFSAHWCPPCRMFTPELGKKYKALKDAGKDFEIVFVSSDNDEHAFKEYYDSMPWIALPFDKRDDKEKLSNLYNVRGIPALVIIDGATGDLINGNARGGISSSAFVEEFPYHKKLVNDIDVEADGINSNASLIVLCEELETAKQDEITKFLSEIAKTEAGSSDGIKSVFTGKTAGGLATRVRTMCKLPTDAAAATFIILDIPDKGGYYVVGKDVEVTADTVKEFVADYKSGKLTRQQLE